MSRLEDIALITELNKAVDDDGFETDATVVETPMSAEELYLAGVDRVAQEKEGVKNSVKLGVDIDDYFEAVKTVNGKRYRPKFLVWNDVKFKISDTVKDFKKHQMNILCSEVE